MPLPSPHDLDRSYQQTLDDMRTELPSREASASRLIHQPLVEHVLRALEIALRPRALVIAAAAALVTSLSSYIFAQLHATPPAGSEPLLAMLAGWAIGMVIEAFLYATRRRI